MNEVMQAIRRVEGATGLSLCCGETVDAYLHNALTTRSQRECL